MGIHSIRMPDIGEGIAETEIAEWMVSVGQTIREDDPMVAVMTDKATVEIPAPVTGTVLWLAGATGDKIAVGAELIRLEVDGAGNVAQGGAKADAGAGADAGARADAGAGADAKASAQAEARSGASSEAHAEAHSDAQSTAQAEPTSTPKPPADPVPAAKAPRATAPLRAEGEKPIAAPSVRGRARDAGIDLRLVRGSGPGGRITHEDLDAFIATGGLPQVSGPRSDPRVEDIKIIGLRRRIAERMEEANRVPAITIVEEVDATALEDLRARMNAEGKAAKLTLLPFIARALIRALKDHPVINQHYLPEEGIARRFGAVHLGIATQTPNGLMVPVLRHAEAMSLRDTAAELLRLAQAARDGSAKREELSGSTITVTSLGPLGAIATTPILNVPEVAIIGINRLAVRPFWNGTAFEPRKMMNISCSFDHRIIDGWDAAVFVQRLKELLETPALIFVEA
ncbi:dihydrolipoamide acetyltransferase family protein [Paracoccus aminophilus]|uniref:Dihydrolipoamide acetyltransferase component of pyruvate dehydrogenase complex n=1 Tax=Paracoccus aminophilus JCM 7686 TaxID=1367847 RepID=S5XYI4_PARAH|nr:dihydrolipoamide acetyltransferase family protein [Paracoccus aminophilus]AGT10367.1 2-oxoisovalerate dehydrogenase E2 component (dihydrolipoyl transacylase) [Paracoccus aminophilus JCM 7686]